MYAEVLEDPKVQRLAGDDFKSWVNVLCLTAKHDGVLPALSDVAFSLRMDEKKAAKIMDKLIAAGLIVRDETGTKPHKWDSRQYKSDVSTDRVKRFRERSKKQDGTENETAPEAETEAETEEAYASPRATTDLMLEICRTAGIDPPDPGRNFDRHKSALDTVDRWLEAGADPALIRETVAQRCANLRTKPRSLAFFEAPVSEAVEAQKAAASSLSAETGSLVDRILGRTAA
jgi:hypothetical protein